MARQCNIDTFDETIVPPHYCGLCDQRCQYCGALYWKLELNSNRQYTKCCHLGKAMVKRIPVPPPFLKSIMERSTHPSSLYKRFFKNARYFNTSASFASCKKKFIHLFSMNYYVAIQK